MTCESCGEKPKKCDKDFTKAVIEINNPEEIVLFRKVIIPISMGDDTTIPPAIGKYKNVLLNYEANNHSYLYSSDGIPTLLTGDAAESLEQRVRDLEITMADEIDIRGEADADLQRQINNKADIDSLAPVATSGSYNDLTNKPTIGDATLTIQKNSTSVGTFSANATENATIDISVPTAPSDIGAQPLIDSSNKLDADLVDDDNSTNKFVTTSDLSKIDTAVQPEDINKTVMTDLAVSDVVSTTTVELNAAKENLMSGVQTTKSVSMPVASTTQAGVMNSSTFDAVANNTNNINALLNGAVAVTGLSASPSQSDITTAWQTETGLTTLINRASVYDVSNDKVWTYYTNDTTWHAASNTTQVTINTFTNSSEGTIKGSTNVGQIFAENDGTGSVNGWDTLNGAVSDNTSNIAFLQTAVAGKQDKLTAGANITISSNTISATDTKYTAGTGLTLAGTQFSADTSVLQEKLTAGNAIDITSNTINADIYPADFFTADETNDGTGTIFAIEKTIPATIEDIRLLGDSFQQSYTGKNLFNIETLAQGSITVTDGVASGTAAQFYTEFGANTPGITFINPNDQIALSATAYTDANASSAGNGLTIHIEYTDETYSLVNWANSVTTPTKHSVVSESGKTISKITISYSSSSNNIWHLSEFQIEQGAEATDFQEFVGGVNSPNPDYPQDIQIATGIQTVNISGKNQFDIGTFAQGSITVTDGVATGTMGQFYTEFQNGVTLANTTPVMSITATAYHDGEPSAGNGFTFVVAYTDGSTENIVLFSNSTVSATTLTGTTDSSKVLDKITVSYGSGSTNVWHLSNIQIEAGTTPSEWTPYQGSQTYTIDLGSIKLLKAGQYQDYIYKDGTDWYLHKEISSYTFDGSEPVTYSSANKGFLLGQAHVPSQYFQDIKTPPMVGYCDLFTIESSTHAWTAEGRMGIASTYSMWFKWAKAGTTDQECKDWLAANTPTVYYAVETPTNSKITDDALINQLNSVANGNTYLDTSMFFAYANNPNLPAILNVTVLAKSLEGVIASIPKAQVQADWTEADTSASDYIKNKPTLATVATTGAYSDLTDKPSLATVATSGSYNDLTNKPTIPAAQVNSDWNAASGVAQILNKPSLATVATSGSYNDLTNKPAIPAAQIQSDWNQTNTVSKDYIKNKPTIPTITMTTTDPGEGSPLADNHFIAVYTNNN